MSNGAHNYEGLGVGRGIRLSAKIAKNVITLTRLEELLGTHGPSAAAKVLPRQVGKTSKGAFKMSEKGK